MTEPTQTIKPVRLQLSRKAGFNLQKVSRATNGLPAVNCARPGKWGNPYKVGYARCGCRSVGECTHNILRCETAAAAVLAFKDNLQPDFYYVELRGKNLACWCRPARHVMSMFS